MQLLEGMLLRYEVKPDDCPNAQEFPKFQKTVRLRVTNFVKRWVSDHWHDFDRDEMLQQRLLQLVNEVYFKKDPENQHFGESIKGAVEERRQVG